MVWVRPAQPDLLARSKRQTTESARDEGAAGAEVSVTRTSGAARHRTGEIKRIEVCPGSGVQACCTKLILEINSLCRRCTVSPLLASVIEVESADRAARVVEEARPPEKAASSGIARTHGAEGAIGAARCAIAV